MIPYVDMLKYGKYVITVCCTSVACPTKHGKLRWLWDRCMSIKCPTIYITNMEIVTGEYLAMCCRRAADICFI